MCVCVCCVGSRVFLSQFHIFWLHLAAIADICSTTNIHSLLLHWHALQLSPSLPQRSRNHHQRSVYNQPAMHEFDFCFYNGNRCIFSLTQFIKRCTFVHTRAPRTHPHRSEMEKILVNEMITRNERGQAHGEAERICDVNERKSCMFGSILKERTRKKGERHLHTKAKHIQIHV